MRQLSGYLIVGGDYEGGGSASKQLKEVLKKIGVDAPTIRRVMIAAYEAEMNTVIHARKGLMRFGVSPDQVEVAIDDEGPGIPDVDAAMREGFSTAPPAARELGFGAGMGLPNIKRNADRFSIQSRVGEGTQIRFRIFLTPREPASAGENSLQIVAERCRRCLKCLQACPTEAIRIRETGPCILDHLCVDCTACLAACTPRALTMDEVACLPESRGMSGSGSGTEETLFVVPVALLDQFGGDLGPGEARELLHSMGFERIRLDLEWEQALREAVLAYAREAAAKQPVVSPVCPAVVNLIRTRYPSLIGHIAPFLTPIEAACEELTAPRMVFVDVCPAQHTALRTTRALTRTDIVPATTVIKAIRSRAGEGTAGKGRGQHRQARTARQNACDGELLLRVHIASGMAHAARILDKLENGEIREHGVLELFACTEGCFGSPVWTENPLVTRNNHARASAWYEEAVQVASGGKRARAIRRTARLEARGGVRLDTDMAKAIEKLARIDALTKRLPGLNCVLCGAPSCAAHAEDVVLGRDRLETCAHLGVSSVENTT